MKIMVMFTAMAIFLLSWECWDLHQRLKQVELNAAGLAQSMLIVKQDYYKRHVREHVQP